jgi:hypothetical protein
VTKDRSCEDEKLGRWEKHANIEEQDIEKLSLERICNGKR